MLTGIIVSFNTSERRRSERLKVQPLRRFGGLPRNQREVFVRFGDSWWTLEYIGFDSSSETRITCFRRWITGGCWGSSGFLYFADCKRKSILIMDNLLFAIISVPWSYPEFIRWQQFAKCTNLRPKGLRFGYFALWQINFAHQQDETLIRLQRTRVSILRWHVFFEDYGDWFKCKNRSFIGHLTELGFWIQKYRYSGTKTRLKIKVQKQPPLVVLWKEVMMWLSVMAGSALPTKILTDKSTLLKMQVL